MIESLRVDDRLIHGQVALVWSKQYSINHIVVANDNAANDSVQQATLRMATPSGIKLLIKDMDSAIKLLNNPKGEHTKIFVLTNTVKDALKIANECKWIREINIANVGRFDKSKDKKMLNSCLLLNEEEQTALGELIKKEIPVIHWVIPSDKKVSVKKLLD